MIFLQLTLKKLKLIQHKQKIQNYLKNLKNKLNYGRRKKPFRPMRTFSLCIDDVPPEAYYKHFKR